MKNFFSKALLILVLSAALISTYSVFAQAQESDMQNILKRLDALEQENQSLREEVSALKATGGSAAVPEGKLLMTTKEPMGVEMYGFVRADGVWSDSAGDDITYNAPVETSSRENDEFNFDARNTRFGFNVTGPQVGEAKVTGKLEADFAQSHNDADADKPAFVVRLRHAYIKLAYPKWDVTAGQTWDFFSPLNPNTLNTATLWRSGNIGTRHPLVALGNNWGEILGGTVKTQFGFIDTEDDAQQKRGFPVSAGHASYDTKVFEKPVSVGIGGLWGEYEGPAAPNPNVTTWGLTVGLKVGLTDKLTFTSEGFKGAALEDFLSGPGTSINTITNTGLESTGGWTQLSYKLSKKWELNGGAGVDFTDTNTTSSTYWRMNRSMFSNVKYNLTDNLNLGLEFQNIKTIYGNEEKGDLNRVMSVVQLNF